MRPNRFGLSIAFFAYLALISQAFAVVDYCCPGMDGHSGSAGIAADMASMHQGHTMYHQTDESAVPDCCQHPHCSMVDCISIHSAGVAIVATPATLSVSTAETLPADYSITYLMADASTLFRPPISR